ncbi:unnamed protein product, partial [Darwinula stevensoni]
MAQMDSGMRRVHSDIYPPVGHYSLRCSPARANGKSIGKAKSAGALSQMATRTGTGLSRKVSVKSFKEALPSRGQLTTQGKKILQDGATLVNQRFQNAITSLGTISQ